MRFTPERYPFPQKRKKAMKKLGESTVPCGKVGKWSINEFTLTEEQVRFDNLRNAINGYGFMMVQPGTYKRLVCEGRGVIMSNTPMEVRTNRVAYNRANGRVLIAGLGMGMLLEAILDKPDVSYVRVIEIDAEVIELVGPHFASYIADGKLEIIHADALEYKPAKGEDYNYVWCDIWDTISEDNLPEMAKLSRRWNCKRAGGIDHWARPEIRGMVRRCR